MMKDEPSSGEALREAADCAPDPNLDKLLGAHPELRGLEPFYIEWELIWPM
jgi:hypothetical protein